MNESDQADITCPHCGSRVQPNAGWTWNFANQIVPALVCPVCHRHWQVPPKPTVDSDLRTKLEALVSELDAAYDKADEGFDNPHWGGASDAYCDGLADAYARVIARLRSLLDEDSTQEENK